MTDIKNNIKDNINTDSVISFEPKEDGVVLQVGSKAYDALETYAQSKGMTVDEVFAHAVSDYIQTHFTNVKSDEMKADRVK